MVSVVIPAFNAALTITRTLRSVRAQTETNLEIIVVDDGSTDPTPRLVAAEAAEDQRIILLSQPQRGVAAARNRGIEVARGAFVAPLDADDLWARDKIAKQLAVALSRDRPPGFVYCFHRIIDADDRVLANRAFRPVEEYGLFRLLVRNVVGNGSALLIPTPLVRHLGGYDTALRDRGLEGVEDWKLQLQLAARYPIGCCPEYLVGYRKHPGAMSNARWRMLQAQLHVLAEQLAAVPDIPPWIAAMARARLQLSGALTAVHVGRRGGAAALLAGSFRTTPRASASATLELLRGALAKRFAAPDGEVGALFPTLRTDAGYGRCSWPLTQWGWTRLERADREWIPPPSRRASKFGEGATA
jgi:hypothetical protein